MISVGEKTLPRAGLSLAVSPRQTCSAGCSPQCRATDPVTAGGLPRKLLVVPTGAMAPAALPAVCRPLSEVPVAWHGTQVKKYGAVKPLLAVWQNNLLAHCCFDLLQLFKRKQSREKKNYNTRRPRLIYTVVLVRQQHNHVQLPLSTHAILFFSLLDH